MLLALTMSQQASANSAFWRWLQSLYNQGREGDLFYSQLTVNAIGDGKVYVHWPTEADANHETTADEIEVNGAEVYTETSPDDATANAGVHGWGVSDDYSDHTYLVYAEPHTGFEVDGLYTDEACTTAYNVTSSNIFTGEGYTAYRINIRSTEREDRANATSLNLYARFVLNVTLNSRGYSTLYYSKYNFKVPTGVTATTYKLGDGYGKLEESRVYSPGDVIPAGEAVVLQGNAGTYKFYPVKTTSNTPDTENILRGTDVEEFTTGGTEYFALSWNSTKGVVGFYWMNSTGAAFKNGAHKAYLALGGASGVKGFDLNGDDATGISDVDANVNANGPIFNLAGQRVGKMQKGINIVNGKKIMVK